MRGKKRGGKRGGKEREEEQRKGGGKEKKGKREGRKRKGGETYTSEHIRLERSRVHIGPTVSVPDKETESVYYQFAMQLIAFTTD
jgi:hypothetical protein